MLVPVHVSLVIEKSAAPERLATNAPDADPPVFWTVKMCVVVDPFATSPKSGEGVIWKPRLGVPPPRAVGTATVAASAAHTSTVLNRLVKIRASRSRFAAGRSKPAPERQSSSDDLRTSRVIPEYWPRRGFNKHRKGKGTGRAVERERAGRPA